MIDYDNLLTVDEADDISPSRQARLCFEWAQYCRSMGWREADIPLLVDLFWQQEGWRTFSGWRP